MNNKIIIVGLVIVVVFLSGCIQSDSSKIDSLSISINSHLKTGDGDYNTAGTYTNEYLYSAALAAVSYTHLLI